MQSGREDTLEERYAIKLCLKLGKNDATETYGMLQTAFQPSCMKRASVFEWHKRFKEDRQSVRDDERCGRSKEVNTPKLIGRDVRVSVTRIHRLHICRGVGSPLKTVLEIWGMWSTSSLLLPPCPLRHVVEAPDSVLSMVQIKQTTFAKIWRILNCDCYISLLEIT